MILQILKNYSSLTSIRVFSRIFDYLLTIYLIRQIISPEILASIVGLELILNISLHIAKQCFKPSYLRQNETQSKGQQIVIISGMNLMNVGVMATIISALIVCGLEWGHKGDLDYLGETIVLFGIASVFESMKEKYSVELNVQYQYTKIALIELVSYFPKTVLFFFCANVGLFEEYGVLLFGIGKIIFYGLAFLITYYVSQYKSHILMTKLPNNQYVASSTKKVVRELSLISFLKLGLQEFEKIFLVVNHSVEMTSVYSLISHIGSIIVRYLFAPLEQIAYNYYSRGSETDSIRALIQLIKTLLYFSTLCISYGFRYSNNVLEIIYKQKWVNAESIRAFDSFLVLLSVMGINGAMQAFLLAKANPNTTIPKFKYFITLSSVCYFSSSYLFYYLDFGASSIFLGNSVGMAIRIITSWNIEVKRHISFSTFMNSVIPSRTYLLILSMSIYLSTKIQQIYQLSSLMDFLVGVFLFGITGLPILKQFWPEIRNLMRKKDRQHKD